MATTFQNYYYCSVFTYMKCVFYLMLSLWSLRSHALGYIKFSLSSSGFIDYHPYTTTIFLGTPAQMMILYIDMGTDLVRVTCGVAEGETMPPDETLNDTMPQGYYITVSSGLIYNMAESSTFLHVFCNSTGLCPTQYQANRPGNCSNETYCILPSDKSDRSNTMYLSMDNLNMDGDFSPFRFACDQYDDMEETTASIKGVLGLGRGEPSFFEEFGHMYDNCLSYCLPWHMDSAGYLAFGLQNNKCPGGDDDTSPLVLTNSSVHPDHPSAYLIHITSITVNKTQISINSSSDQSGILVNPTTFFTTLPTGLYQAMRDIFKEQNNSTVLNGGDYTYDDGKLDLCFDTSNGAAAGLNIPRVLMTFANDATVELDEEYGIIYVVNETTSCLGFKENNDPNSPSVFGGMQHAKLEVGIDTHNEMVGFRRKAECW